MEEIARALEASELAAFLRRSRWTYPTVNALHVLGIAVLVGAVVPMDLRLIGRWRPEIDVVPVLRLLRPIAAAGAGLAIVTGGLLFIVQARDYASQPLFTVKLTLIAVGLGHALAWGTGLERAPARAQRLAGAVSLAVWTAVLFCGRFLGYL